MTEKWGKIQVFTGDGKGKTTAALGEMLRALGHKKKVLVIQFLKGPEVTIYGEIISSKNLKEVIGDLIDFKQYGRNILVYSDNITPDDKRSATCAWKYMINSISEKKYDMLILDEILPTLDLGLINLEEYLNFIYKKPKDLEVIVTGRMVKENIINSVKLAANLVSYIKCEKHYNNMTCPKCNRQFVDDKATYLGCPFCVVKLESISSRKGVEF